MTNESQAHKYCILGIALIVIYCLFFAVYYSTDPLAQMPQLDARENLVLANQFSENEAIDAPFYRAVLYPYALSFIQPESARPLIGLIFGLACHLINGYLVWRIAGFIWGSPISGIISACLYLLNPASLFYSVQLMDITLGITFLLCALLVVITRRSLVMYLLGGLLLGFAVVTRPHFLPAAIVVPFVVIVMMRQRGLLPLLIYSTLSLVLILQGLINFSLSGEFRILPWQGTYNLYAANRPGANGLYYEQTINVSGKNYSNSARAESEILYQAETGSAPPFNITDFNQFWKNKAVREFKDSPVRVLKLWLFKSYAVVNSYEQYNNLTFSYHKTRFPMLSYNPMNWGILLVLSTAGFLGLYWRNKSYLWGLLILLLSYTASLVLYYASAKFRLPLVPILAIVAGGSTLVFGLPKGGKTYLALSIALITGLITFSSLGEIRNKTTWIQDDLLMANANAEIGNDFEAASFAKKVLTKQPERTEALRIYTISFFNMHLINDPNVNALGTWSEQKRWVKQSYPTDPIQDTILGVFFWQWGENETAKDLWDKIKSEQNEGSTLASACLLAISDTQSMDPLVVALRFLFQKKGGNSG